jgi:hypothetical protein
MERHAVIAQTSVAPCGRVIPTGLVWLLFLTEINLVRSQRLALPSEPCIDLAAICLFLTWESPGLHGRNLLRLLWESPLLVRSRGNVILSTGEGTILALEPFVTFDRQRAEQPRLTSSHNIEYWFREHIYSATFLCRHSIGSRLHPLPRSVTKTKSAPNLTLISYPEKHHHV